MVFPHILCYTALRVLVRQPLNRQLSVFDAMWLVGIGAETTMFVGLVVSIVTFKPIDLAVALKGEHVRGDTIEEPAIMRDHHCTAGEGQ